MEYNYSMGVIDDTFFEECKNTRWMTRSHNMIWKTLNQRESVGDMSYLFWKYNPKDYKDFWDKYTSDINILNTDLKHSGRSVSYLLDLAKTYKERSGNTSTPLPTYFKNIVWHIIVQTYDGLNREREFMEYIKKYGYTCDKVEGDIDAGYGIDLELKKNGNHFAYLQIKPMSFCLGNSNAALREDRKLAFSKREKVRKEFGKEVWMIIYKKDESTGEVKWHFNENGVMVNSFEHFISPEGYSNFSNTKGEWRNLTF